MSRIHQITHQNPLIAKKVNFFADYFEYLSYSIGITEDMDIDNHLSLVEKILWQVESNLSNSIPYVDNYLNHPYLQKSDRIVNEFGRHNSLFELIDHYKKSESKKNWIQENPAFISKLKSFRNALKRDLIRKTLSDIISFLRCVHDLDYHRTDLLYHTKIIISEFLINGHSRKDLGNVFEKIMTRDFNFPFPKKLDSHQAREEFLSKRTFDQQFQGIMNLLRSQPKKHYFLFRIIGVRPFEEFEFKYNQVTFYHPLHPRLKQIREANMASPGSTTGFFEKEDLIIAVISLKYYSLDIAEKDAVAKISSELAYLNSRINSNGYVEKYTYLKSPDLKVYSGRWGSQEDYTALHKLDLEILKNNPHVFLKTLKGKAKAYFLKHEKLFTTAMTSGNVEDYWQYLEAVVPLNANGTKQVMDVVSLLLLLKAETSYKSSIADNIRSAIAPFAVSPEAIGLNSDQQMRYFEEEQKRHTISFNRLRKESNHPFLHHLLDERKRAWHHRDFIRVKKYYHRILSEAYAQRNAIIHKGEGYEKSLITVNNSFPWIITRFRWVIFYGLRKKPFSTFSELIKDLKSEAEALLDNYKNRSTSEL
ncbi:MAG TPA: hypothetical protein VGQ59_01765 [Cyclobacteriaceae bacterium]|jgi:hypothetical protein|nr:hypothetical protein [Cyclobacteriaceae bacterium]